MRIFVLGSGGQVGHALVMQLRSGMHDVICVSRSSHAAVPEWQGDLAAMAGFERTLDHCRPDVVINAAAYTAVDRAETEPDLCFRINANAPAAIATACASLDIPLIHYSTDYVFDGNGTLPYLPDHPTAPLGVYGESKLAGELGIRESGAMHVILRTAWVYGNHGHNFMRTMLKLADREELNVVNDQIGSPTPAWLVADVTAQMIATGFGAGGIHHVVAAGETSWAEFSDAIFDEALKREILDKRPRIIGIPSAEYPTPAKRPAYSVLDTTSLCETYGIKLPHWQEALAKTLDSA